MSSDKNWSVDDGASSKLVRKAKESPFVPIGKLTMNRCLRELCHVGLLAAVICLHACCSSLTFVAGEWAGPHWDAV